MFRPLTSSFPPAWFKTALCLSSRVCHLAAFKKPVLRSPSPCKELLWQLLASIAEFERKLILQRCEDGRARGKLLGKHLGRHSKTTKQQDEQIKLAHDQGQSYAQIAKTFGISRMSVYRRLTGHVEAKKESETNCKNNQKR